MPRSIILLLSFLIFLSPLIAEAAAWTAGGKIRDEMSEVILNVQDWTFENPFRSIELKAEHYVVKTGKCEFIVSFKYQQEDPEHGVKRTMNKKLVSGKKSECDSVFLKR